MKFKKKTRLTDNLFKLNYSEKAEGYFITSKITKELHRKLQTRKGSLMGANQEINVTLAVFSSLPFLQTF